MSPEQIRAIARDVMAEWKRRDPQQLVFPRLLKPMLRTGLSADDCLTLIRELAR